jgi:hypothetical protein
MGMQAEVAPQLRQQGRSVLPLGEAEREPRPTHPDAIRLPLPMGYTAPVLRAHHARGGGALMTRLHNRGEKRCEDAGGPLY